MSFVGHINKRCVLPALRAVLPELQIAGCAVSGSRNHGAGLLDIGRRLVLIDWIQRRVTRRGNTASVT